MQNHDSREYSPEQFLDAIMQRLQLKDDKQLARALNTAVTVLAKIRSGELIVSGSLLLWIADASGIAMEELKAMLGDRRRRFRPSCGVMH